MTVSITLPGNSLGLNSGWWDLRVFFLENLVFTKIKKTTEANILNLDYMLLGWCVTPGTSAAILWPRKETLLSCPWCGKPLAFNDMVESWIYLALKLPFFWTFCKIINPFYKFLVTGSTLSYTQEYHNWHTSQFSVVFSLWNALDSFPLPF